MTSLKERRRARRHAVLGSVAIASIFVWLVHGMGISLSDEQKGITHKWGLGTMLSWQQSVGHPMLVAWLCSCLILVCTLYVFFSEGHIVPDRYWILRVCSLLLMPCGIVGTAYCFLAGGLVGLYAFLLLGVIAGSGIFVLCLLGLGLWRAAERFGPPLLRLLQGLPRPRVPSIRLPHPRVPRVVQQVGHYLDGGDEEPEGR